MKTKGKSKFQNKSLFGSKKEISKLAVAIKQNVCEEKKVCPLCHRGGYFGLPLVFVLRYADESIRSVCFSCGAKAAKKADLKLPQTEAEVFGRIEAKDNIEIQKARRNNCG